MKDYKIESNIPIPKLKGKIKSNEMTAMEYTMDTMDIGLSFSIYTKKEYAIYVYLLSIKYKDIGKKFISRTIGVKFHKRIWRVK